MWHGLELETTAYTVDQIPEGDAPQVALAGRSNVGKSSLINCLGGRKKLAKISSTPGKTRSINFFRVRPGGYHLVDLPGYGYAKCSKKERDAWAKVIEHYFTTSPFLKKVAVLLDCRLDPQQNDLDMTAYIQNLGIPLLAVLTKADKVKQRERSKRQSQWREMLKQDKNPLLFSSKTGMGRDALWSILDEYAQPE